MRTPHTETEPEKEHGSFASAHESARRNGYTGTVEVASDDEACGGAVFLNGAVVYAQYLGEVSESALDSLLLEGEMSTLTFPSTPESVRMFRTYLRYISNECLLVTEPLDSAAVEPREVEGVIFEGVRNSAEMDTFSTRSSVSVRANAPQRSFFPEGRRTVLAPDLPSLHRHISENEVTGYAVGDCETLTFRDGEMVDKKRVDMDVFLSVRADAGVGGGWVVVNTEVEEEKEDGGSRTSSLLGRIF